MNFTSIENFHMRVAGDDQGLLYTGSSVCSQGHDQMDGLARGLDPLIRCKKHLIIAEGMLFPRVTDSVCKSNTIPEGEQGCGAGPIG